MEKKDGELQKHEASSQGLQRVYGMGFAIIISPIGVKVWLISMALLAFANYTIWTKKHLFPLTAESRLDVKHF